MRFLLDANLPRIAVAAARDLGFEAQHTNDVGLRSADDETIWAYAVEKEYALVTRDLDFGDIRAYPTAGTAGRLVLRVGDASSAAEIRGVLHAFLERPEFVRALSGRLAVVQRSRVRFRPALDTSAARERRGRARTERDVLVGLDLAWKRGGYSGMAVIEGTRETFTLASRPTGGKDLDQLVEHVRTLSSDARRIVVAIDAPLVVTNEAGQRDCERDIGTTFGRFDASAHSTNLGRYPDPPGVELARRLHELAFGHLDETSSGRSMIEVYPHPAQVRLFGLERSLKYKKGRLADRKVALADYRGRVVALMGGRQTVSGHRLAVSIHDDARAFFEAPLTRLTGKELKAYEDELDAVFCALLALAFHRTGRRGNDIYGNAEQGYIVVPKEHPLTA